MPTPSSSPLDMEPDLVARLQDELKDLEPKVHILTAADLAGVMEERQLVPAVHVLFAGMRPVDVRRDGRVSTFVTSWLVVVAVRNVRTVGSGAAARAEVGPLVGRTYRALNGFKPAHASSPLFGAPASRGPGFSKGYQYVPLAFEANFTLHKEL